MAQAYSGRGQTPECVSFSQEPCAIVRPAKVVTPNIVIPLVVVSLVVWRSMVLRPAVEYYGIQDTSTMVEGDAAVMMLMQVGRR
jgi:hypothetical protein